MKQHFVTFTSTGTFVSETTQQPIDSWDVKIAMNMARSIKERHNAVPYGFYFSTRERTENELDSKITSTSNFYYLGGKIETYDEVCQRDDPKEQILRSNMKINNFDKIIINTNSWKFVAGLKDTDVVLEWN